MSSGPVLAVDFDGVIADAFEECSAVTYFAHAGNAEHPPDLATAIRSVPDDFKDRFRSVRPHCRTLDEFMIAHYIDSPISARKKFTDTKLRIGSSTLENEAARGEKLRSTWRTENEHEWLLSHTVWPQVVQSMRSWPGHVWVVSAKDENSIRQILDFHEALDAVHTVAGSCNSKKHALAAAANQGATTFIDDNLQNVIDANDVDGVTAKWATWGYSSDEDARLALSLNVPRVQLDTLGQTLNDAATAATIN